MQTTNIEKIVGKVSIFVSDNRVDELSTFLDGENSKLLDDDVLHKVFLTAINNNHFECIIALRQHGFFRKTLHDDSIAINAFRSCHLTYLKYCIENGITKLTTPMQKHIVRVMWLISPTFGHVQDIMQFLKEKEFDFTLNDNQALGEAVLHEHKSIVEFLINNGCDPELPSYHANDEKENQLVMAVKKGKLDMIDLLLRLGVDVHANDDYALKIAVEEGDSQIVQLLLDAKANPNAISDIELNELGETQEEAVQLIRKYQNSINLHEKLSSQLAEKEPVKKKKRDF
jgi:hypothetical protein